MYQNVPIIFLLVIFLQFCRILLISLNLLSSSLWYVAHQSSSWTDNIIYIMINNTKGKDVQTTRDGH